MKEIKEYIELRIDEVKLKLTQAFSVSFARIASLILILDVLLIVLGLFAFASVSWLSHLVGGFALASTIVLAFFVVILLILIKFRKRMFRDSFVRTFIKFFYGDDE